MAAAETVWQQQQHVGRTRRRSLLPHPGRTQDAEAEQTDRQAPHTAQPPRTALPSGRGGDDDGRRSLADDPARHARRAAIIHDQNTTDSMPQNSPPDATRPRRCTSRGSMRLRVHFDMRRTLPIPSPALHDDASPPLSLPGSAHRLDRFLAPAGTTRSRALISSRRKMESQLHVELAHPLSSPSSTALFACNVNQDHVVRAHTVFPYHTFVRKLGDRSIRHHRRPTTHRASEATWG
ncbi:hypothetical protein M409DRAFT_52424 [Zasmidium cellare ATCC 36951]|uniref:Uncharacterized protein n=1 Tax=Zasmidium cellare ATCC 36951 TaxID=1080233 RepID=A0A6A6CSH7_ZASCE|nr:uncharacterized protein M409DRAFT_52424 [Zasmidium cellare ATCC 36951]KAF2169138.1 hypothetical protein M409DRAFT_52424 [Zasmidium cellare ATCC 36951]